MNYIVIDNVIVISWILEKPTVYPVRFISQTSTKDLIHQTSSAYFAPMYFVLSS